MSVPRIRTFPHAQRFMVETAGTKLRRARTQRHLSLEDAARATKIQLARLQDLESDDYSNFANLAYARGFLVAYGKYLHLDTRPYMDAFADASTFGLDDYQYLSDRPVAEYRAPQRVWRKRRQTSVRQVAALAVGLAVLAVAAFGFYVYVNYRRLGNLGTLVERQSAPAAAPQPAAEAAVAPAGDAARPAVVPVSSTPAPGASAPPEVAPAGEETRNAAAALAAAGQNNSPAALLTQLTLPALKAPGDPNGPLASPTPVGDNALPLGRAKDKPALPAMPVEGSKPQKVSNDARR